MVEISNVMSIIQEQFEDIMASDPLFYDDYKIILTNEQQFIKEADRDPNAIYLVVKFLSTAVNYGQVVMPITINAIGEQNHIEVCQHLLLEYAQTWNLKEDRVITDENGKVNIVKQLYSSPQVTINFNTIFDGFRTLFFMTGTFLIGENSLPITKITCSRIDDEVFETPYQIQFVQANWTWSNQLDSQAYTGTNSRTVSRAKISTLAISLVAFLTDTTFFAKILGSAFNNTTVSPSKNKTVFYLNICFGINDSFKVENMAFRLSDVSGVQSIGEFPSLSLTFTE